MIKVNTFTPQGKIVRKVSDAAKNLNKSKSVKLGESGLPKEEPLDSFREKRAVQMLKDSFGYDKAKDSIIISTLNSKR